jgi:hypothetical protein
MKSSVASSAGSSPTSAAAFALDATKYGAGKGVGISLV